MLNLVKDGTVRAWQATGWQLIDWGPDRFLLIGRDGGWYSGAGAEVCYEAIVWNNEKIMTVGPPPEARRVQTIYHQQLRAVSNPDPAPPTALTQPAW